MVEANKNLSHAFLSRAQSGTSEWLDKVLSMNERGDRFSAANSRTPKAPARIKVTSAVKTLFTPIAEGATPSGQYKLFSEVLDVDVGDHYYFLNVRDTNADPNAEPGDTSADDVAIKVWVPRRDHDEPEVRQSFELEGRFEWRARHETARLEMVFVATRAKRLGTSGRWTERLERYEGIRAQTQAARPALRRPQSVQLVTSPRRDGERDFRSWLAQYAPDIAVETTAVKLNNVDAIARGIREAAAVPGSTFLVIVRGGGDAVDLDRFNHPTVVQAVAEVAQHIPVVVGVGHERNKVVAAAFATREVITPTDAARFVAGLTDVGSTATPLDAAAAKTRRGRRNEPIRIVVDNDPFANVMRWILVAALCIALGLGLGYLLWGTRSGSQLGGAPPPAAAPVLVEEPAGPPATESPRAPLKKPPRHGIERPTR
jgi:hypothetical protein